MLLQVASALISLQGALAEVIAVELDTHGEPVPQSVCVIALDGAGQTIDWPTIAAGGAKLPGTAHRNKLCSPQLLDKQVADLTIVMDDAAVSAVTLRRSLLRVEYRRAKGAHGNLDLALESDKYKTSVVTVPTQLFDSAEIVRLSLKPRRVFRRVLIPPHFCKDQNEVFRDGKGNVIPSPASTNFVDLIIDNEKDEDRGRLVIARCGHEFSAEWRGPAPPQDLKLQVTKFSFTWKKHCLAARECPHYPQPVGVGVVCTPATDQPGECAYSCTGTTSFPSEVLFNIGQANVPQSWKEVLSMPGLTLSGFVSPDQRRLRITWEWLSERTMRARRDADEIRYVELRSPEGRLYRIREQTSYLRMPELDCHDYVSYRYFGTRNFDEKIVKTDHGVAKLGDPSWSREDRISVGFAVGGGLRAQKNTEPAFGGFADAEAILSFRRWKETGLWSSTDIELRLGGVLSTQPYHYVFMRCAEPACERSKWESTWHWRIPAIAGINYHLRKKWTLGIGPGFAVSTNAWMTDAAKARPAMLFTARAHVGYQASRAFAIEMYLRYFFNEWVMKREFDVAGTAQESAENGWARSSFFLGLALRIDDII